MPDGNAQAPAIDLSAGLTPKPQAAGGIDLSAGLISNSQNSPDEVAARHARSREGKNINYGEPGGETGLTGIATGVGKEGLATIQGATRLVNKATSAFSSLDPGAPAIPEIPVLGEDRPTKTEGLAEGVGGFGENVAEWMTGDAALEGVAKLAKIAKNAPHLLDLMEKFPKTAKLVTAMGKGAAIGGTQAAVKEGDVGAAPSGAAGGAVGAAAGEVVPAGVKAVAKQFGIGTTAEEDIMKAAQPYKKNFKFIQDWAKAKDRIAQELDEGGKFKNLEEAADRIGDVRRKIWTDEVMPAVDRHAKEVFDTSKVAAAVRNKITPELESNFPEDAKELKNFADRYTSGSPLFGTKTVANAEKEIELYNAKLADEGYWKKTPKERAVMEKANPKIAAWRTASDELRESLYGHIKDNPLPGDPDIAKIKDEYGAVGNIENEIRGQVNVAGKARPLSLKKIIGMTAGLAHGGPGGLVIAAAPVIDAMYNSPEALLNRAVSKSEGPGTISKAAKAAAPAAKAGAGVTGEQWVKFTGGDGVEREVHPEDVDAVKKADPGAKFH